jgi:hypothetical protein
MEELKQLYKLTDKDNVIQEYLAVPVTATGLYRNTPDQHFVHLYPRPDDDYEQHLNDLLVEEGLRLPDNLAKYV